MHDTAELGTILGIWAHPDDDIFCSAGLMATAVRSGQRVVDVTATRGEGGSMDEERWPPESMAEVRTKELLRSLEISGRDGASLPRRAGRPRHAGAPR